MGPGNCLGQHPCSWSAVPVLAWDPSGERWLQEVLKADALVEIGADAVAKLEYFLCAIMHQIDVHPKRPLSLGEIDDADDLARGLVGASAALRA